MTHESLPQNKTRTRMTRMTISDKMFLTITTITNTRSRSSLDNRTSLYRGYYYNDWGVDNLCCCRCPRKPKLYFLASEVSTNRGAYLTKSSNFDTYAKPYYHLSSISRTTPSMYQSKAQAEIQHETQSGILPKKHCQQTQHPIPLITARRTHTDCVPLSLSSRQKSISSNQI